MSTTNATLPRAGGNGAALVMVVADLVMDLFAKAPARPAQKTRAVAQAASVSAGADIDIWQLYRMNAGSDSVSPKVAAKLRARLAD